MNVPINELNLGSKFRLGGGEYKLTLQAWTCEMVLRHQKRFIGEMKPDDGPAHRIHPKLGGEFQEKIELWIAGNQIVEVK